MKVLKLSGISKKFRKKSAVTIGVFDGMHRGHLRLIKKTVEQACKTGGKAILVTFDKHPEKHFKAGKKIKFIKDPEAKIKRAAALGIDIVTVLDFRKISGYSPEKFIEKILVNKLNAGAVIAGSDFVFGKNAGGNKATLKKAGIKYGFKTIIVSDVRVKGKKVSSTAIRKALKKGDIKIAEAMLGRKYAITGKVIHGKHLGFAFPTANIRMSYEEIPAHGVWAVLVERKGKKYAGAANIGIAPTLKKENRSMLEVYILGFKGRIYGEKLKVTFLQRIRPEKRFSSYKKLVDTVKKDIKMIRNKYRF